MLNLPDNKLSVGDLVVLKSDFGYPWEEHNPLTVGEVVVTVDGFAMVKVRWSTDSRYDLPLAYHTTELQKIC